MNRMIECPSCNAVLEIEDAENATPQTCMQCPLCGKYFAYEKAKDAKIEQAAQAEMEKTDDGEPPRGRLVRCPDCGREISRRASNCPHCGAPMNGENGEREVAGTMGEAIARNTQLTSNHPESLFDDGLFKCPSCGHAVSTNAKFCPKCGRHFPKWEKTGIGSPLFLFIIGVIIFFILMGILGL